MGRDTLGGGSDEFGTGGGAVDSVNGQTGIVVLAASDVGAATTASVTTEASARSAADALLAPLASPALTGNPTVPTQTPATNSTKAASTAYADAAVAVEAGARSSADALLAPLASPALTGNPTVPTQTAGNNSTRVASTAYTDAALATEVTARSNADAALRVQGWRLTSSSGVVIVSAAAAISFDTEIYDDANWHESITHPSRITVTLDGLYSVGGICQAASSGTNRLLIWKNGVQVGPPGQAAGDMAIAQQLRLVAGDYLELAVSSSVGITTGAGEQNVIFFGSRLGP